MITNLSQEQKEVVFKHLNDQGKLTCVKALQVAKQLNIDTKLMADVANSLKIKISDCELGVFGKKELGLVDSFLYTKIVSYSDQGNKVTCTRLWEEAKESTMKKVRSTTKQTDIFVTYCKLGCFKEGKGHGSKN